MTTLILTGTIKPPNNAKDLTHTDPQKRLQEYKESLIHHIGLLKLNTIDKIIFIENSNYGTSELSDLVIRENMEDKITLISYDGNNYRGEKTRFFGESEILYNALKKFSQPSAQDEIIWKVTGRYIVKNLDVIIKSTGDDFDMAMHFRDYPLRYVDFGLVGFKKTPGIQFFEKVLNHENAFRRDESLVRELLASGELGELKILKRLPEPPDFKGIRGSDSSSYEGWKYRLKFHLRRISNRVLPSLWI